MSRIYKQSAIYDCRIFNLRNLWEPSTSYMGKAVEKPNYLVGILAKKTRANWYEEPALAGFAKSCKELYDAALSHIPFQQVIWPIKDGDVDELGRAVPEWRRGNWLLNGSSTTPIEVSINQGGVIVPLRNRVDVKPGDHVMVTTSIAIKTNDPRGIKTYINKVVFMGPGEEIVIGSSISTAELMAEAKAQGLNVTGFGGGAPQEGFGFGGSGGPQQGFQQGFAPTQAPPAGQVATGQFGNNALQGGTAFPSSGLAPPPISPPGQQGFAPPAGFNAPTGFPPRS
jgi:Enterobacter phage Enc34, ssDNA-binding protein